MKTLKTPENFLQPLVSTVLLGGVIGEGILRFSEQSVEKYRKYSSPRPKTLMFSSRARATVYRGVTMGLAWTPSTPKLVWVSLLYTADVKNLRLVIWRLG